MPAQGKHQSNRILIVVTAGKSDDMNVVFALRDRVRDM